MKAQVLKIALFVLIFFCGYEVSPQNETSVNTSTENESYAVVDLNFISDAIFLGRKDTVSAPYLYTSLGYHHRSGVYAEGSVSYLTKSNEGRIDLFLLSAGFEKEINKLNLDLSATKYFFNDDSYNVISEVEADITAQLIYDFDFVNLGWAGSIYFSSDSATDFLMLAQVSHDFTTSDRRWQISPIFELQFGSQQFYEQYFIEQTRKKSGMGTGSGSGSGSSGGDDTSTTPIIQLSQSESFQLMAIELNLAIWYQAPPFTFSFIPSYVIPSGETEILVGDSMVKEDIESTFYWMAGISYKF